MNLIFITVIGILNQSPLNIELNKEQKVEDTMWQETYQTQAIQDLTSYESFVSDTEYYDYNDPIISSVALDICEK